MNRKNKIILVVNNILLGCIVSLNIFFENIVFSWGYTILFCILCMIVESKIKKKFPNEKNYINRLSSIIPFSYFIMRFILDVSMVLN